MRLLFLFFSILPSASSDSLLASHAIFRHGARAPVFAFSSDQTQKFFFRGLGELSDLGIQQSVALGKALRARLVDTGLLDKRYIPKQASFYSSFRSRCLMTAAAVGSAIFDRSSGGISIPVAVQTEKDENNFLCIPQYPAEVVKEMSRMGGVSEEEIKGGDSFEGDELNGKMNNLLLIMFEKWTKNTTHLGNEEQAHIAEAVIDESFYGLPQPVWYNKEMEKEAADVLFKFISFSSGTGEYFNEKVIKCSSGFLLNTVMENIKMAANGTANYKRFLAVSTHDIVLQSLLASFGIIDVIGSRPPPFGSSILIELWKSENTAEPYVKILWRPNSSFEDLSARVAGCESQEKCAISKFTNSFSQFMTSQPEKECA